MRNLGITRGIGTQHVLLIFISSGPLIWKTQAINILLLLASNAHE